METPRGTLFVVGLGPGSPGLRTPDASKAIEASEVVVGYRYYLDQVADLTAGKELVGRDLGEEVERARIALEMARLGRVVALVSSGDAGVYGMGGVVGELVAADPGSAPEVVVVPGVTAALAASARLGSPLAHDWASISLSDLLTPWDVITRRVEAASRAGFAVAIYNPASRGRRRQLPAIAELLLGHRPPSTPVGLVENAFRAGERVEIIRLDELAMANVTMFTIVLVGAPETILAGGKMVTPRILAAKSLGPVERTISTAPAAIMAESLAIIDGELGRDPTDPAERAIVRRMIHASADFDFRSSVRFGPGSIASSVAGLLEKRRILTDVQMLRAGVRRDLMGPLGVEAVCALDEPETADLATSEGLTRSAAAIRRAAERVGDGIVVAIGNAPTALTEAIRLVEDEGWRPACIVGIPVGFVGRDRVEAAIDGANSCALSDQPRGRKGGTAVTAAVVNALLELAGTPR